MLLALLPHFTYYSSASMAWTRHALLPPPPPPLLPPPPPPPPALRGARLLAAAQLLRTTNLCTNLWLTAPHRQLVVEAGHPEQQRRDQERLVLVLYEARKVGKAHPIAEPVHPVRGGGTTTTRRRRRRRSYVQWFILRGFSWERRALRARHTRQDYNWCSI